MSAQTLMVDCHKIMKWLQQRKKLPNNWYNFSKASDQKIKILMKNQDEYSQYPELKKALQTDSEYMSYFDVCKFVELLLQTDIVKEKSLLFGYSDKRAKQWTNLKKFMESKNIGLVSNAKYIEQCLKFDLPSLNKSIQMMDSQLGNLKRKIDFNKNTIFQQESQMKKQINNVGLSTSTQNQQSETYQIQSRIPSILAKVPETIQNIENRFVELQIKKYFLIYKQKLEKDGFQSELQVLEYFLENKNDYVDVYLKKVQSSAYSQSSKYSQFLNWKQQNQWQIVIESNNNSNVIEQVSSNKIQLNNTTLLEDRQTRQHILNNLNELQYFFKGLLFVTTSTSKSSSNRSTNIPASSGDLTELQLTTAVKDIQQIIELISHKRLLTPLELKNNKKAYQHFISKFNNLEKNIRTLKNQIIQYNNQIEEIQTGRLKEVEKLRRLRRNVFQVKVMEEDLLSKLIGGGKQVKIVGQINKLE